MYMELTPEDTIKDLETLLIDQFLGLNFLESLTDYVIETLVVEENEVARRFYYWGCLGDSYQKMEVIQFQKFILNVLIFMLI